MLNKNECELLLEVGDFPDQSVPIYERYKLLIKWVVMRWHVYLKTEDEKIILLIKNNKISLPAGGVGHSCRGNG